MSQLKGKRVVITRSYDPQEALKNTLESAGAEVLWMPLIETVASHKAEIWDDVASELATYEWIVFTSANGVRFFFDLFFSKYKDIRCLGIMRIACVGESTLKAVEALHLQADLVPDVATAEGLSEALVATESLDHAKVLVVEGNLNRDVLPSLLMSAQAIVDSLQVYETRAVRELDQALCQDFRAHGAHAIVFASPSAVASFAEHSDSFKWDSGAVTPKLMSIGPQTTQALKAIGLAELKEAREHSPEGILKCLIKL